MLLSKEHLFSNFSLHMTLMSSSRCKLKATSQICKFMIITPIGQAVIWSWISQGTLKGWLGKKSKLMFE